MPDPYQQALAAAGLRVNNARAGLADPQVAQTLSESESPGVFEQAFRFLGRPGFAVRSALSGDVGGVARNVGQFLNEAFFLGAGALNPNLTLTGVLDNLPGVELPNDITSRDTRPEFTDLLKRWGVTDPKYMGPIEKGAADLIGGFFTDPLSLVGGVAKGVAQSSLVGASRWAAARAMFVGAKQGGLEAPLMGHLDDLLRESRVALGGRPGSPQAASMLAALSTVDARSLESIVGNAAQFGMQAEGASDLVRRLQDKAAERLLFRTAKTRPGSLDEARAVAEAAAEGVNLIPATRTFLPSPTPNWQRDFAATMSVGPLAQEKKMFSVAGTFSALPDRLKQHVRTGELRQLKITEDGLEAQLLFKPENEALALRMQAQTRLMEAVRDPVAYAAKITPNLGEAERLARTNVLKQAKSAGPSEVAALHESMGRMYGYADSAIDDYLRNGPDPILGALTPQARAALAAQTVTPRTAFRRFSEEIPSSVMTDALAALKKRYPEMRQGSGLEVMTPWGSHWKTINWSQLYGITLPGMLTKAFGTNTLLEEWGKAAHGWVKNRFVDRYHPTRGVDPAYASAAPGAVLPHMRQAQEDVAVSRRWEEKFKPAELTPFTKEMGDAHEQFQAELHAHHNTALNVPAHSATVQILLGANPLPASGWHNAIAALGAATSPAAVKQILENSPDMLREGYERLVSSEIGKQIEPGMLARIDAALPGRAADVRQVVEEWRKGTGKIPNYMRFTAKYGPDLKKFSAAARAAWQAADENPFYVPQQMTRRLQELLDEGIDLRQDFFANAKDYPNRSAFLAALQGKASDIGLALPNGPEEIMLQDFASLYRRRMVAFRVTEARQELYQRAARIMGRKGGQASDYEFYINRVMSPTSNVNWATGKLEPGGGGRTSVFSKILGGGTFTIPVRSEAEALRWAGSDLFHEMEGKAVRHAGRYGVEFKFPGMSAFYKAALTSIPYNVKFRVRNTLAMPHMMNFVPGMGLEGWRAVGEAIRNGPMLRSLSKGQLLDFATGGRVQPFTPGELNKAETLTVAVQMLTGGTQVEKDGAQALLTANRWRFGVGGLSAAQVVDAVKLVTAGTPLSAADLDPGLELVKDALSHAAQVTPMSRGNPGPVSKLIRGLRAYVKRGEDMAAQGEAYGRITAMLEHLRQGRDPIEAALLVEKQFVNYSRQSAAERFVRDFFPFARFMIGSTQWIKPMIENPRTLNTLAYAQRSLMPEGEQTFLPTEAQESLALPLPWKDAEGNYQFITSLGLPHEAAMQMLAVVGSQDARRKYALGAISPPVRGILEEQVGRTFYHGTEFASYRRAPAFLPDALTTPIPGREGRPEAREISGLANEIMNALPTAGAQTTVDRLFDSRRAWWNKLIVTATGARTVSVDLRRELKRRVAKYLEDKVASGQIGEVQAFFTRVEPDQVPADLRIMLDALAQERANARRASR